MGLDRPRALGTWKRQVSHCTHVQVFFSGDGGVTMRTLIGGKITMVVVIITTTTTSIMMMMIDTFMLVRTRQFPTKCAE